MKSLHETMRAHEDAISDAYYAYQDTGEHFLAPCTSLTCYWRYLELSTGEPGHVMTEKEWADDE